MSEAAYAVGTVVLSVLTSLATLYVIELIRKVRSK